MAELPILDVRGVGKTYELNGLKIEALRDANLTVRKGAPGLASVPHRLVVMNDVCGCELLMDSILCMFVAGLGLVSLLLIGTGILFKRAAKDPAIAPITA